MSFGKNLQFLRHLRGDMTQENLAEKINISRQTVSKWELDTTRRGTLSTECLPLLINLEL